MSSHDGFVSVTMFVTPPELRTSSAFRRSLPQPPYIVSRPVPPTSQSLPRSPKSASLPSVGPHAYVVCAHQIASFGPSEVKLSSQFRPPAAVLSSAPVVALSVISRNGSFGSYCAW